MSKTYQRDCPHCREPFQQKRKEQRFCSRVCAYEGRKAESVTRFWARVVTRPETGCRVFTGHLAHKGHGVVWWFGRNEQAHRIAWQLAHGAIPEGLCVLHDCPGGDNPDCVNVRHLWLGDKAANNADRDAKGRTARGDRSGSRLHPERRAHGEQFSNAKLRTADVLSMRQAVTGGITHAALARKYGVSKQTVGRIVHGKAWRHVA